MKKQILVIAVMGIIAISNAQVIGLTPGTEVGMKQSHITAPVIPKVTATDPENSSTDIALNKVVAVTFSVAMDPSTINPTTFTLKQGETAIAGKVEYSETTATYTPAAPLTPGTVYTATISTGVKSSTGEALATETVVTFTTIAATPVLR